MNVDVQGARANLKSRCDTIEEAYEFFLAYASQGLPSDANSSHPIRDHLKRFDAALAGIRDFFDNCVVRLGLDPGRAAAARSFIEVLEDDAGKAQSAIRLVLAQPSIGSQTIDNLNASIHIRALLTDLFLIDEILRSSQG
ncbi:MAG TPA: hypothetical protein VKH42_04575 [Vicinamibacterales bacterium]|nr:hypothetical protein [Vicinamibacterales bacterium]